MNERDVSGNVSTWSVILGVLLGVLLFLGSAYSGSSIAGLGVVLLVLAYVIVLSAIGRVNVFQVLWGGMADESDPETNQRVILLATVVIALVAVGVLVYDLASESDWGWFSWLGAAIAIGYLAVVGWHHSRSQ
ncbi:MAG TPA: hypothetical protein VGR29_04960 [Thermomicrobiales bacterium]|nr:hypothetical protein [Thermomicrobiales bacterium]